MPLLLLQNFWINILEISLIRFPNKECFIISLIILNLSSRYSCRNFQDDKRPNFLSKSFDRTYFYLICLFQSVTLIQLNIILTSLLLEILYIDFSFESIFIFDIRIRRAIWHYLF